MANLSGAAERFVRGCRARVHDNRFCWALPNARSSATAPWIRTGPPSSTLQHRTHAVDSIFTTTTLHTTTTATSIERPIRNASPRGHGALNALVFDAAGVLFDDALWRKWLFQLLQRIGLHSQYVLFYRVWEEDYLGEVAAGRLEFWAALRRFLLEVGMTPGQIDEVLTAGHSRLATLQRPLRALPKVESTLRRLRLQGVRLGVLAQASRLSEPPEACLRRIGLAGYFDAIIPAHALADAFPRRFAHMAERLDCHPTTTGYVGATARELRAARQAGLRTLAVHFEGHLIADRTLDAFEQLLEFAPRRESTAAA